MMEVRARLPLGYPHGLYQTVCAAAGREADHWEAGDEFVWRCATEIEAKRLELSLRRCGLRVLVREAV